MAEWTKDDDALLRRGAREGLKFSEMAAQLSRSPGEVKDRCLELHIRRTWTPPEDERLLEMEGEGMPRSEIAYHLERTVYAVKTRLRWHKSRTDWDEDRVIAGSASSREVAKQLGRGTVVISAARTKSGYRKGRPWSANEDAELLRLKEAGLSNSEIAEQLDRASTAIASRVTGLVKRGLYKTQRWTSDELARLAQLASDGLDPREIAKVLGRSTKAIRRRLDSLRNSPAVTPRQALPWTKDEEETILRYCKQRKSDKEIAASLGRSVSSVRERRRTLGIEKLPRGRYK